MISKDIFFLLVFTLGHMSFHILASVIPLWVCHMERKKHLVCLKTW